MFQTPPNAKFETPPVHPQIPVQLDQNVISLTPQEPLVPQNQQIQLSGPEDVTLSWSSSPEELELKAQKAHFALGDQSPGIDVLRQNFQTGSTYVEKILRDQIARQEQLQQHQTRLGLVDEITRRAAAQNKPITFSEQQLITELTNQELVNPDTILEKLFARRLTNTIVTTQDPVNQKTLTQALNENEDQTYQLLDVAERQNTQNQVAVRLFQEVKSRYDATSWTAWTGDLLLTAIPGYSWWKLRNRTQGATALMTGTNLAEQALALRLLPPDQFEAQAKAIITQLASENVLLAVEFASALVDMTSSDRYFKNAMNVLDVAAVAPIKTTLRLTKAASPTARLANRLQTVAEAPNITPADALVAAGNTAAAADEISLARLSRVFQPVTSPQIQVERLMKETPGMLDPQNFIRNPGTLANERAAAILESVDASTKALQSMRSGMIVPRVVEPEAIARAFEAAKAEFMVTHRHLQDSVIEIIPWRQSEEVFGGVDQIVAHLGHIDKTPFESLEAAKNWAVNIYRLPEGGFTVQPYKGNWTIQITKPVDETVPVVRDFRIQGKNESPITGINTILGWARNPDDVLSPAHSTIRKTVMFGPNWVAQNAKDATQIFRTLNGNQRGRLQQVLEGNMTEKRLVRQPDGSMKAIDGNWYDNPAEFQTAYHKRFGEYPAENEIASYFTYRRIMEESYGIQNIAKRRDMERLGGQQFSLNWSVTDAEGITKRMASDFFNARIAKSIPWERDRPFTIAFQNEKGEWKFQLSSRMFKGKDSDYVRLNKEIADGTAQVLEPFNKLDPVLTKLVDARGEVVDFVVARTVKTKPLDAQQIPYRAGPRTLYEDGGWFVKAQNTWVSRFGRRIVGDDNTLLRVPSRAQAKEWEKKFNTARVMLDEGVDPVRLEKFVVENLPYRSLDEFKGIFKEHSKEGIFSVKTPFITTANGQRAGDVQDLSRVFKEPVVDTGNSQHSLQAYINNRYGQHRTNSLMSVENRGTQAQPVFNFTPAQTIDPIQTVNRVLNDISGYRFFDDYKHFAVEDWVTRFGQVLDRTPDDLMANPLGALTNPVFKKDTPLGIKNAARDARRAILQLLDSPNLGEQFWQWSRDQILDAVATRGGDKMVKAIEPWMWSKNTDPVGMARGIAFHMKLGLYNIVQYPLQAQQVFIAAAIDGNPIRAIQASHLAMMMRWHAMGEFNPQFATHLGKIARRALGVSEDTYKELHGFMKETGVFTIGAEHALRSNLNPKIVTTRGQEILDSTSMFFKEGERTPRLFATALAYLRWRSENPTAALTNTAKVELLGRIDTMTGNMTKASQNPLWQSTSFPALWTQWSSYHTRLSELLLGGRLTLGEKTRIWVTLSMLYGIPTGTLGATFGAFAPVYDLYRKYALDNDVDFDNPFIQGALEGLPNLGLTAITGQEWGVANRYGPGGLELIKEIFSGNPEVFLGPGGKIIRDILKHRAPFLASLYNVFDPQSNDEFPITAEIFLDATREVSTMNNIARAWYAYNTGQLLTRGEVSVTNMTQQEALFAGLTGLVPQGAIDVYLKREMNRDRQKAQAEIEKQAQVYFQRALRAAGQNDRREAEINFQRVRALLKANGYTAYEHGQVMQRWLRSSVNGQLIDQVDRQFIMRGDRDKRLPRLQKREQKNLNLPQGEE